VTCSSSCRTRDHASYGECLRAKNLKVAYEGQTLTGIGSKEQRDADKNLENYAQARKYGIQPKSTQKKDVDRAIRISEQTGKAYQA
jgi:hypothetical protein